MKTIINNIEIVDTDLKDLDIAEPIGASNPPLLAPNKSILTNTEVNEVTKHTLQPSDFKVDWQAKLSDEQLDKLSLDGWIIIDEIFANKALIALQNESGFIDYRDAQLTAGVRLSHIRGDKIRWINDNFLAGCYYLQSIDQLSSSLNRALYTGIRHVEAHYACYPLGFGYQWHSDNPVGRDERVISAVFYLNDDWSADDGGAVEIIDNYGVHHEVMPVANRLIIFNSNLQHQVQTAHRQRYSIATWMRRDGLVPFIEES